MNRTLSIALVFMTLLGGIGSGVLAAQVGGLSLSPRIVVDLSSELAPPNIVYLETVSLETTENYTFDFSEGPSQIIYTPETVFGPADTVYLLFTYDYLFDEAEGQVFRSEGGLTTFFVGNSSVRTLIWHLPPQISIFAPCPSTPCVQVLNFTELPVPSAEIIVQIDVLDPSGQEATGFTFQGHGGGSGPGLSVGERFATEVGLRFQCEIPSNVAPGVYIIRVTVTDLVTGMSSSMTTEITVEGI